jgi:hypothetical protein
VNTGVARQNLSVVLTDASGGTASVAASSVPNDDALIYPEGIPNGHVIMNQIRFPLSMFAGVDLSHVTSVRLVFDQTNKGVVDVSDMAFTKGGVRPQASVRAGMRRGPTLFLAGYVPEPKET